MIDDLGVMVAGQGGDGSLTVVGLLGDALSRRGFHLHQSRNVASRVKGGHAAGYLRASLRSRGGLGDRFDLLIAFDDEAVAQGGPRLREDGWVIHDASDGPAPRDALPAGATVLEIPFARMVVRDLRRDLYKNSLAFGVAARLVGVGSDDAASALRRSLSRLPEQLVEANLGALAQGFAYADGLGVEPWELADGGTDTGDRLLLSGNEALALGFLVAGGRFFAGYPITPASEILECLDRWLPDFGGVAVQAEDELSAINMALGAALAGTRSMTASSGPGIALMQEGVGHLGAAEVGVVVVDSQRAGPSTGMPTKPEQSDIGMLVYGANGDFPRIVLAASDPADAFELAIAATNLAERFQGPVYVVLDQAVSQDSATIARPDLGGVRIDRGKRLGASELSALEEYRRYSLNGDGDGISSWAPVGTPGGVSLVTGNERDEWGRVSAQPAVRVRMVEKRARKLDAVRAELPRALRFGPRDSEVGLIGFGMAAGATLEAAERLGAQALVPRTLWPVLEDVRDFAAGCRRVYVVEHNATGQYAQVLASSGVSGDRLASVIRYDGLSFRPGELVETVCDREGA